MQGYIDYWKSDRGWGFILTDDNQRFFVHISAFKLQDGQQPVKGSIVTFDEGRTSRGAVAINVQIASRGVK